MEERFHFTTLAVWELAWRICEALLTIYKHAKKIYSLYNNNNNPVGIGEQSDYATVESMAKQDWRDEKPKSGVRMRCLLAGFVLCYAAAISLMRVWFKAVTCLSLEAGPHSRPGSMISARTGHQSGRGRGSNVASYWLKRAGMVSLGQSVYPIHY